MVKVKVHGNHVEQLLGDGADVDPHAFPHLLHHPGIKNGRKLNQDPHLAKLPVSDMMQ